MTETVEEKDAYGDNIRDKKLLESLSQFSKSSYIESAKEFYHIVKDEAILGVHKDLHAAISHLKELQQQYPYEEIKLFTFENNYIDPKITKDISLVLLMMPQWDPSYAPYNLARLAGITTHAGYRTHVFDINIESYQDSRAWVHKLPFDPWNSSYMTKWFPPEYKMYIHEHIKPFLDRYVDKVVALNPTVIGFTIYDANRETLMYLNSEIRKKLPNVISVLGGPICHRSDPRAGNEWEYIVSGEGEKLILEVLRDIEVNGRPTETKKYIQEIGERNSLDELPPPNWNFYNFNLYRVPNAATLEFSRGCIAKCVFCDETHFWKYRGRESTRVIEEVTDLWQRGVNSYWFVDSLINGNLKELRSFCHAIKKRQMNIHWVGYARCDERMDLEYFKDMKDAGCYGLSFGVESGSDKVLKDMAKEITAEEVFKNFRDGAKVGLQNGIMLIVGFPTEEPFDLYKTMELMWRVRNFDINFIGGGYTMQLSPETIIGQDRARYGVLPMIYGLNFITEKFDNTKLHRLIRLKTTHICLEHLKPLNGVNYNNRTNINSHYTLTFEDEKIVNDVEPEEFFDFNIVKLTTDNNVANTIFNEVWPLFRMLYRGRGGYEIVLNFDQHVDFIEFPHQLTAPFDAVFKFKISSQGEWVADFKAKYTQPENYWHYDDHNWGESNPLKRIQKFVDAKARKIPIQTAPAEGYSYVDPLGNLRENVSPREWYWEKYRNIDLSFDIAWQGSGKW